MPFHVTKLIFDGGLKARGVEVGWRKYTIKQYEDLQDILKLEGRWYYRGLNDASSYSDQYASTYTSDDPQSIISHHLERVCTKKSTSPRLHACL